MAESVIDCPLKKHVKPHHLSDLWKTLSYGAEINQITSEYLMGHRVDDYQYLQRDKQPQTIEKIHHDRNQLKSVLDGQVSDAKLEEQGQLIEKLRAALAATKQELAEYQEDLENFLYFARGDDEAEARIAKENRERAAKGESPRPTLREEIALELGRYRKRGDEDHYFTEITVRRPSSWRGCEHK